MAGTTIGIMGGSFNPVHIGHLIVADYVRQVARLDRVLMMLSPLNPLKAADSSLADDRQRLAMLEIACRETTSLEACALECEMPRPSYTINTLNRLSELYPADKFKLIIGSDNWLVFNKWRSSEEIIGRFGVIVYPRPGYPIEGELPEGVTLVDAPNLDISSTFVRNSLAGGLDVSLMLPPGVYKYIIANKLYK